MRRRRRSVPLAALSLALAVLMDAGSLLDLYRSQNGLILLDRGDATAATSTQHEAFGSPTTAMQRNLLRRGHDVPRREVSQGVATDPDQRHEGDPEHDGESVASPAPAPSVRRPETSNTTALTDDNDSDSMDASISPSLSPSPTAISPYEERWPGYNLPWWARKQPGDDNRAHRQPTNETSSREDHNHSQPEEVSICFIHVGKTAGSTVGCALGFALHCHGENWHPHESLLHRYTTNVHHSDINDCSVWHDYYLVTVRDPVERLLSWYEYERRKLTELRLECNFRTLNDLAVHGLGDSNPWISRECRNRARRAIVGEQQFGYHGYHNYNYHMRQVPSNGTVLAIRSEHLVDDWNSIEVHLGSDARVESFPLRNRAYNHTRWRRILSDEARNTLCYHLCDEIQVYKSILDRSVNLNGTDVQESMVELRRSCPREADLPSCPQ